MKITKETKLSVLIDRYPWLREDLKQIHKRFALLSTPAGRILSARATIAMMAGRSGMDPDTLIRKIRERIEKQEKSKGNEDKIL